MPGTSSLNSQRKLLLVRTLQRMALKISTTAARPVSTTVVGSHASGYQRVSQTPSKAARRQVSGSPRGSSKASRAPRPASTKVVRRPGSARQQKTGSPKGSSKASRAPTTTITPNPLAELQTLFSPNSALPVTPFNTFVTFCAGSRDYYAAGLRLCRQVQSGRLFSRIVCYTDHDLRGDEAFWSKHGEFVTNNKRGFGYWIWKAFVILKELDMCDGVLMYCDAGCEYKVQKEAALMPTLSMLQEHPIMIPQTGYRMIDWTKRDVLIRFGMDTSEIHEFKYGEAGLQIMRKDARVTACLREWWEIMEDYHMVDDSPSIVPNHAAFREHRHDQMILNLCLIKHSLMYRLSHNDREMPVSRSRNRTGISRLT